MVDTKPQTSGGSGGLKPRFVAIAVLSIAWLVLTIILCERNSQLDAAARVAAERAELADRDARNARHEFTALTTQVLGKPIEDLARAKEAISDAVTTVVQDPRVAESQKMTADSSLVTVMDELCTLYGATADALAEAEQNSKDLNAELRRTVAEAKIAQQRFEREAAERKQQLARHEALFYYEKGKTLGDLAAYLVTPRIEIPVEGEPFRGPANAKHTIVIFSDFECPVCGKFEEWFDQYIEPAMADPRVGGVKLIFKHWPICTECNEYAVVTSHPSACKAARAAEAARIVGGDEAFWKMHDLLFKRRDEWKKSESFVELAREIGLDENAFSQAMDSPDAIARIKRHVEEGEKLAIDLVEQDKISENVRYWIKVHSTPSIYIDNKRLYTRGKTETWYKILGYNPPEGPSSTRPSPATTRPSRAAPPRPAPPRR